MGKFEWQVAKKHKVPVVCVLDMQNCLKRIVLEQVHATEPYLLSYQMIEYTLKIRRQATEELAQWLNTVEYCPVGDRENAAHGMEVRKGGTADVQDDMTRKCLSLEDAAAAGGAICVSNSKSD